MAIRRIAALFLLLAILVAVAQTAAAQQVMITSQYEIGGLQLPGLLHKPNGNGPFSAVVMLCGCDGYAKGEDAIQQSTWAKRLVGWGYVALQLVSCPGNFFAQEWIGFHCLTMNYALSERQRI